MKSLSKSLFPTIAALAVAAALAFGASGAPAATHSAGRGVVVAVGKSGLGQLLVDGRGRTLYLFAKDGRGASACAGACAGYWPPLIAAGGKPRAAAGARASLLGTLKRADGRLQVTYNRHPLYTFVEDTSKGQTKGEEVDAFGAEWYAISPAGSKVEKNHANSRSGGDPSAGGYGY